MCGIASAEKELDMIQTSGRGIVETGETAGKTMVRFRLDEEEVREYMFLYWKG